MIEFTLNGIRVQTDESPDTPLLWAVRDTFKLKGSKFGCGAGLCGSCTMHVEGDAVRTCVLPIAAVAGKAVTTIEGLAEPGELHPLQEALELEWNLPPLASLSTERLQADYRAGLDRDGDVADQRGDLAAGFGQAGQVVEKECWAPYLAHAPMEPMNAVVRIQGGEADVWTGCQGIVAAQGLVARYSGLEKSKVRAHNTYLGGGFGRRATASSIGWWASPTARLTVGWWIIPASRDCTRTTTPRTAKCAT